MTKDEALRMAIEIMERLHQPNGNSVQLAIQACKDALAETQEPVYVIASGSDNITVSKDIYNAWTSEKYITTPPSREWVGLSDEEIELLWHNATDGLEHFSSQYFDFSKSIIGYSL